MDVECQIYKIMTTVNILITVSLTLMVLAIFLYWGLMKYFASMSKDKQNCPFDHNHCGIIGRSTTDQYITKICKKCSRYKNWKNKKPIHLQAKRENGLIKME